MSKKLLLILVIIFSVSFTVGWNSMKIKKFLFHSNIEKVQPSPAEEEKFDAVLKAYKAGDETKLKQYAEEYGWPEEEYNEFKERVAALVRLDEKSEALKEREKTLGNWEDAVNNGKFLSQTITPTGYIFEYYDVTGDGIADFEIIYLNNKPYGWRYCDETGEPYG